MLTGGQYKDLCYSKKVININSLIYYLPLKQQSEGANHALPKEEKVGSEEEVPAQSPKPWEVI